MIRGQQRGAAKARDRNEQGGMRNSEKADRPAVRAGSMV